MRRLFAFLVALAFCSIAPATDALAHGPAEASDSAKSNSDAQEARDLSEELRIEGPNAGASATARAEATKKAERRADLLKSLAKSDPGAVLDAALDPSERARLPGFLQAAVEEWAEVSGELRVLHVDHEDGHSEYDIRVVSGSSETSVSLGRRLLGVKPGDRVRLRGVKLANDNRLISSESSLVAQSTAPVGPTGVQKTAVILASGSGAAAHPYANKTNTASVFFASANPGSAYNFYLQASYNQTTIAGGNGLEGTASDVYGPYTLNTTSCDATTVRNAAFVAADPDLNFSNYQRIVISYNNSACGGGGVGTVGAYGQGTYDGANQILSVSWDFNSGLGSAALNGKIGGVALHEFGHNLGVWHANTLECGSSAIQDSGCASTEYGDPADVMGSSGGYGHLNGLHKEMLTWLSGGRAQLASSSGQYTINAYEDGSNNVKVLKLPRTRDANGNPTGFYYLEYRKPTATWNGYLSGRPDYGNGVIIHVAGSTTACNGTCSPDYSGGGGGGDSSLIDTQPNSISSDWNDAPLLNGESYSDPGASVQVQVVAADASSATVQVTMSTPKVSVQSWVYPAGTGTVTGLGSFTAGQSVTLTAVPAPGYTFVRWRENRVNQAYPNPYTFTVTSDRLLEAQFAQAPAPANNNFGSAVNVASVPSSFAADTSAATTETGEPTAVDVGCGSRTGTLGKTVWYRYTPATSQLTTISTAGSGFDTVLAIYTGSAVNALSRVACNDDNGGPQSRIDLNAVGGTTYWIQASGFNGAGGSLALTFSTSATYQLDVTKAGTGSGTVTSSPTGVSCGVDCSEVYAAGTRVTLTAAAQSGSSFTGWSGACTGTGSCLVTMDSAGTVTATFDPVASYQLDVAKAGTGSGTVSSSPTGVSCGSDCTESYTSGTVVTLTAAAQSGSSFAGWSGACSGTGTCSVTMTGAKSVTATFNPQSQADLQVTLSDSPDPVKVKSTLTYSATVRNNGPASASGVTLRLPIPGGTAFTSASASQGSCSNSNGTVTCNLGSLGANSSATVTVRVRTSNRPSTLTATATVSGSVQDPTSSNNSASATTTVQR
jgi:uncharacterized repeat protein (TIGR01451 family)